MSVQAANPRVALGWVRDELDQSLSQIRTQIENVARQGLNGNGLTATQANLEQLRLTFDALVLKGAAMLSEEMAAVCQAIGKGQVAHRDGAINVLMDAIVVLPSYLDRLQAGHHDLPILLLPVINDLRAANDRPLLTEGTLFAPDLDVRIPEIEEPDIMGSDESMSALSHRMRRQYENALLTWLQDQQDLTRLAPLHGVCETLQRRVKREDLRRIWWVAGEVVGGLMDGDVDNDIHLRRLFARLHLVLKKLSEDGIDAPDAAEVRSLTQALLYHAAQAPSGNERLDLLRDRFNLRRLIPDRGILVRARGAITGRNREMFEALGTAVREELSYIKDTLDLELRTGHIDDERRDNSLQGLERLQDTLKMLGLNSVATSLEELLPAWRDSAIDSDEREEALMSLAQELVRIESELNALISSLGEPLPEVNGKASTDLPLHEFGEVLKATYTEIINTLHKAQEAMRQRLEGKGGEFREPLEELAGVFELLDEQGVAERIRKLLVPLDELIGDVSPDCPPHEGRLEAATDAVAALELYAAGARDRQEGLDRFIEVIDERLERLDAPDEPQAVVEREPAPVPEPAVAPTDVPASGGDEEILEIFLEEFEDVMGTLEELMPAWQSKLDSESLLVEVRRGFHTLKGSGRMAGAIELGDFAWAIESMLNAIIEKAAETGENAYSVTALGVAAMPELRNRLQQKAAIIDARDINAIAEAADAIRAGDTPDWAEMRRRLPSAFAEHMPAADSAAEASPSEERLETTAEAVDDPGRTEAQREAAAERLAELVRGELREHISALSQLENPPSRQPLQITDAHVHAAHSILGLISMSPGTPGSNVAQALERLLGHLDARQHAPSGQEIDLMGQAVGRFRELLAVLDGECDRQDTSAEDKRLASELMSCVERHATVDRTAVNGSAQTAVEIDEVTAIFLEEAEEVLGRCDGLLNDWQDSVDDLEIVQTLQREIHTFKGGARMAGLDLLGELSHEMETVLERIADGHLDPTRDAVDALVDGCDQLQTWVDALNDGREPQPGEAVARFQAAARILEGEEAPDIGMETVSIEKDGTGDAEPVETEEPEPAPAEAPADDASDALHLDEAAAFAADDVAQDEAGTEAAVDDEAPIDLQAEAEALAAEAEAEEEAPSAEAAAPEHEAVAAECEADLEEIEEVAASEAEPEAEAEAADAEDAHAPRPERAQIKLSDAVQTDGEIRDIPEAAAAPAESGGSHIRVSSELMDTLVNAAGEISICRSRMEQQVEGTQGNLKEFDQTVSRLREQLRKLEIETEAQILSRHQRASDERDPDFDPLEMDRYSTIQQLSRALSESVADLVNLQEMLEEATRQSESLLSQQSRVSNELQEGLMQARMVHFGSIAPRMRRVVRQAARDAKRQARLELRMAGTSDQLDRNVLERITAPIEHLLRNAIAHGIEAPSTRKRAKKPEEGEIAITVSSEATEFVIRVSDDGSGLDLDAIRERAIERGMIDADADVQPAQLMEFILQSGFSTSKKVTELAGRGVGMDVVNSEIRQIGGSIEIASEKGQGTCFTIRIPFSLAVMPALTVVTGSQRFFVPLASVAGVSRMQPEEYSALMEEDAPVFDFGGQEYPLFELETLLGAPPSPLEDSHVSILMIQAGDQQAAFRVPALEGHREIVVKPVGPQVSSIPGILGGAVSADGQVVLILDMGPLIRHGLMHGMPKVAPVQKAELAREKPLVMVVDDSITMRKVTTRVLENQGFDVVTAKDGVDATEQLQDLIPDLMLLDIEMPRMDGFGVAEFVRADPRFRHIPIVMITSRSGDKHRNRAKEAGVNDYLIKPYQESDLLERVHTLVPETEEKSHDRLH